MTRPRIGFTVGDAGGIGPECVFRYLNDNRDGDFDTVVFGPSVVFDKLGRFPDNVTLVETGTLEADFVIGKPDAANGRAAYDTLIAAIHSAMKKDVDALVTAPLCKESLFLAKIKETGHTTILAKESQSDNVSMAFYTEKLKTVLVTVHNSFKDVPRYLTEKNIRTAVTNSFEFAAICGCDPSKIAIAGLNPHAGENGYFGREEIELISPVLEKMAAEGKAVLGPISADTLFHRAVQGEFDIVISLYHDQGLIPIKLLAFDTAVNVTLGLPFIRTSPDHGTAFNIAYKGVASLGSFANAVRFALNSVKHHVKKTESDFSFR